MTVANQKLTRKQRTCRHYMAWGIGGLSTLCLALVWVIGRLSINGLALYVGWMFVLIQGETA